ncbi:MAG: polymerase sigma-70 factor, subfamily protein [Myxococcaceae bacterium]|nr:polymerase sigma-70 factor, subfamily protein [Myxococcaceae bacterium]
MNDLLRQLAPQVLGALVRRHRDFGACEDALQEALIAAAAQWPSSGLPDNPRAWLTRVARRRLTDVVRSESSRRDREALVVSLVPAELQQAMVAEDDTLDLFFMCCHPALSSASATALTLRAVGGLTTQEIARAFLVPEATMAQRLSRARQTIRDSGVPFEAPDAAERAERLSAVMRVVYLIFSEGYVASSGAELSRVDLSNEAIRLGRLLQRLLPDEPEVTGLLALMLLTDARREARSGSAGELIPLDVQDRSRWNRQAIAEGSALISLAFERGAVGPYQIQAAIAALHDEAKSAESTDWPQILALYGALLSRSDNPMVALNHAIALAMVSGPRAGLDRLTELERDARLKTHHRFEATRAHLLERAGDRAAASSAFERAAAKAANASERDYLYIQAARLRE